MQKVSTLIECAQFFKENSEKNIRSLKLYDFHSRVLLKLHENLAFMGFLGSMHHLWHQCCALVSTRISWKRNFFSILLKLSTKYHIESEFHVSCALITWLLWWWFSGDNYTTSPIKTWNQYAIRYVRMKLRNKKCSLYLV